MITNNKYGIMDNVKNTTFIKFWTRMISSLRSLCLVQPSGWFLKNLASLNAVAESKRNEIKSMT